MKTLPPASKFKRTFIRQHSESFSSCLELVSLEFGKADESKVTDEKYEIEKP